MMLNLVLVVGIVWGLRLLFDAHKLIRKATVAIDRDQSMLDQITDIEPEYEHISLEELNIIAIDTTDMAKQDAVLAFIDAWEKHHEQSHD